MRLILLTLALAAFATYSAPSMAQTAAAAKTETVDVFGDGKLEIPAEFKRVPPQSRMLAHEFQASAGEGDDAATARVTMMAAGGGAKANITRWQGQFAGGDKAANKTEELKIGNWEVHLVDANGSYAETMGGGPFSGGKVVQRTDYAMAGAILINPAGKSYFVKMIGPAAVVKANRQRFVKMIKSIE
ncbi:hypothetical protein K227x_51630 [Rubripirellula lacrimiformis]|uniref:Uncharacterized protein n=1 Tax=Rubripirellula lacrimiformis TaxID=1930273 RepID=A0A517NHX7_9BACT|nr:hypothetical protein [Rubripirellula lacrimiformis]QDT06747.1 hypothetical protein K227x_51630 [Rubripirellula lacrimiformis]